MSDIRDEIRRTMAESAARACRTPYQVRADRARDSARAHTRGEYADRLAFAYGYLSGSLRDPGASVESLRACEDGLGQGLAWHDREQS